MPHSPSASSANRQRKPHALELATGPELQLLLDHFAALFDIRIGFFSPTGQTLRMGMHQSSCDFCVFLRKNLGLEPRCRAQDRAKFAEAAAAKGLVTYHCHAGLIEAVQAVRLVDDSIAGFIMIGQFRMEGSSYAESLRTAARGRPEAQLGLDRLFDRVPTIAATKLPHLLAMFSLLVDTVANRNLVQVRGDLMLNRIERLIQERLEHPLSLAEAARAVGRSPSTISHLFTRHMGKSFKQAVLDAKLNAAERLLRTVPGLTVAEVAARVGYSNPFHFSRLFRKHKGVPPSTLKLSGG